MIEDDVFENDIKQAEHDTGVLAINYQDLIQKDITIGSNCNLDKFEELLSKKDLNLKSFEDDGNFLSMVNGVYRLNAEKFKNTQTGVYSSGLNVLFYNDTATDLDKGVAYHEMAHAYQHHDILFSIYDLKEIDKLEMPKDTSQFRSYVIGDDEDEKKLENEANYVLYLQEVHAEVFANAVLMLRSNNKTENLLNQWRSVYKGVRRRLNANFSIEKEYPSAKYYDCLKAQKALVRKFGQEGEMDKYFLPKTNGKEGQKDPSSREINFSLLAKEMRNLTIDNVYSYKKFQKQLDRDVFREKSAYFGGVGKASKRFLLFGYRVSATVFSLRNSARSLFQDEKNSKIERRMQNPSTLEYNSLKSIVDLMESRKLKEASKKAIDENQELPEGHKSLIKNALDARFSIQEKNVIRSHEKNYLFKELFVFSKKGEKEAQALKELWKEKSRYPEEKVIKKPIENYVGYKFDATERARSKLAFKKLPKHIQNDPVHKFIANVVEKVETKINKKLGRD